MSEFSIDIPNFNGDEDNNSSSSLISNVRSVNLSKVRSVNLSKVRSDNFGGDSEGEDLKAGVDDGECLNGVLDKLCLAK